MKNLAYKLFIFGLFFVNAGPVFALPALERESSPASGGWTSAMGQIQITISETAHVTTSYRCSGTAITQKHVLTAAHCMKVVDGKYAPIVFYPHALAPAINSPKYYAVKLILGKPPETPLYNTTLHNDWALLELNEELPQQVRPLGLVLPQSVQAGRVIDRNATLAGYPNNFNKGDTLSHENHCLLLAGDQVPALETKCSVSKGHSGGAALLVPSVRQTHGLSFRQSPAFVYGVTVAGEDGKSTYIAPSSAFYKQAHEFVSEAGYKIEMYYTSQPVGVDAYPSKKKSDDEEDDYDDYYGGRS